MKSDNRINALDLSFNGKESGIISKYTFVFVMVIGPSGVQFGL